MYRLQSITRRTATNCVRAPDNLAYLLTKTNTELFRRTRAPAATIASRGRIIRRVLSDVPQATPVNSSRRPGPPPARTADAPPPRRLIVEIRRTTASERVSERGRSRPPGRLGGRLPLAPPPAVVRRTGPEPRRPSFFRADRPTDRRQKFRSVAHSPTNAIVFVDFLGRIAGMQCFDAAYFYATHVLTFAQRIGGFGEDALYKLTFYITFASDSSLA